MIVYDDESYERGGWNPDPFAIPPCGSLNWGTANTQVLKSYRYGSKIGSRTSDYHRKMKEGAMLPLNAYLRVDAQGERSGSFSTTLKYSCAGKTYYKALSNGALRASFAFNDDSAISPPIPNWEGVNTNALLISAMGSALPELDALTSAVEAKETFQMIKNVRSDAKHLILEALRGGKHTVKAAADAWLAWRYGWSTLAMDIEALHGFILQPVTNLVFEGRAGESHTSTDELDEPFSWISCSGVISHKFNADVSYRANVVGMLKCTTLNAVADPAITAWESVPFSFVADWFVNVGDVLSAWKVRRSLRRAYYSVGRKVDMAHSASLKSITKGSSSDFSGHSGNIELTETLKIFERIPMSAPSLVPSIDVNLTSKRIADAAALLSKRIL